MIETATSKGVARPNINGWPGQIFEYDFKEIIGVDMKGNPTSVMRVIVNSDNTVKTAFPVTIP